MIAITESHLIHISNEGAAYKSDKLSQEVLPRSNYSIRVYRSNDRSVKNTVKNKRLNRRSARYSLIKPTSSVYRYGYRIEVADR